MKIWIKSVGIALLISAVLIGVPVGLAFLGPWGYVPFIVGVMLGGITAMVKTHLEERERYGNYRD